MANVNITKRAIQEAFLAVLNEKSLGKMRQICLICCYTVISHMGLYLDMEHPTSFPKFPDRHFYIFPRYFNAKTKLHNCG